MEETQQTNIVGTHEEIYSSVINEPSQEVYVPSSTEKKRAVMIYFLIGIIITGTNNQKKTDFEQFHFKQALGWRSVFLFLVIMSSIFMFIPMIKYIPLIVLVILIGFLGLFIKNAWDGKYSIQQENKLAIFMNLGEWIMTLFEVKQNPPE